MLLPAILDVTLIGIPYLLTLLYLLLVKKNQSQNINNPKVTQSNKSVIEPQQDNEQSFIKQNEDEKKHSIDIEKNNKLEQDVVVISNNSLILQRQQQNQQIEIEQRKTLNQKLPPLPQKQETQPPLEIQNNAQMKTIEPASSIIEGSNYKRETKIESQIYSIQTSNYLERIINIFLLLSCLAFIQSLISRVYVVKTQKKIDFPSILYLGAINTIISLLFFQIIYGYLMNMLKTIIQIDLNIFKSLIIVYGLVMPFPIYSGLDNYIKLDTVTLIFAILYMIPLLILMKKYQNKFQDLPIKVFFEYQ